MIIRFKILFVKIIKTFIKSKKRVQNNMMFYMYKINKNNMNLLNIILLKINYKNLINNSINSIMIKKFN